MASDISTTIFYVAPSKERHPFVSRLLQFANMYRDGQPPIVKVTRQEGFLTGRFETCDGDLPWGELEGRNFPDFYNELCALGYLSEDHRYSWWCSNGDGGSTWFDVVGDKRFYIGTKKEWRNQYDYEEPRSRTHRKAKAREFWEEFPNLMRSLKYDPPESA